MENNYRIKYLKYKLKYIKLQEELNIQNANGKKKHKKKNSKKKLQYIKKSMPKFLKTTLSVIKYGTEEVPILGEVESLINVILSTSSFYNALMSLIESKDVFKKLLEINFDSGPSGVKTQYNDIWPDISDDDKKIICEYLPQLFNKLKTNIEDWISTIPEVGPAMALVFENTNVISYDTFNDIFDGLPEDAQNLFQNPELLHKLMNKFIKYIRGALGVKKAGNILKYATKLASDTVSSSAKVGLSMADTQFKIATKPIMTSLKILGVDQIVVNKTLKYMNKVLNPAINVSIKALKIIFPLFFTLLLANDDCQ
jgi:hypothetical protein